MISKQEIMSQARNLKLAPDIIEKDYVLSWVLAGIHNQQNFRDTWIFKGGTCLKKCFFENYRFSEDLDFTLKESKHIDSKFLHQEFVNISQWIYDRSGIEIPESNINFEVYENPRDNLSVEGGVAYRGPLQRRGSLSRIKLDLTTDEKIVLEPELRKVFHPYSDVSNDPWVIMSYCFEEIFAEKLRALAQRLRPRDLYDVVCLHLDKRWKPDHEKFFKSLKGKCDYKGIPMPTMDSLSAHTYLKELSAEWRNMLAHQISDLLPVEYYWGRLPEVLDWVYSGEHNK